MVSYRKLKAIIFLAIAVLTLGVAIAAGTPAGTEIRNQASASYIDSAGQSQTTTSNEVVTVVQPVYSFTIAPDSSTDASTGNIIPGQSQSGVPGSTVYFPYTVTNTGNSDDTIDLTLEQNTSEDEFDPVSDPATDIYLDENCNGQIDAGESAVTSVDLAADESACLIVAATIPDSATEGQTGLINLSGTSQAGTPNDTSDDVAESGDPNWAEAIATEKAVLTSTKSASPSGEVSRGGSITYTIEGSNVGGAAAYAVEGVVEVDGTSKNGILIEDAIPDNTTFDSIVDSSAGAGSVSVIYYTGSSWTATAPSDKTTIEKVGMLIEDTNYDSNDPQPFFPQGAQYKLSFTVTVNETLSDGVTPLPADTSITNTATVSFSGNNDGDADDDGEEVTSNSTTNTVAAEYSVYNGPSGEPENDNDDTNNTFTVNGVTYEKDFGDATNTDDDTETITSDVYGGDTVYFPLTLQNNGNTDDTFDLSLNIVDPDTSDGADPTTWSCQIVAADGTTPISGPVGPIGAGETYDYMVKCSIPAEYTEDGSEDAAHIQVTATSEGDPGVSNIVTAVVPDVQSGYAVDIADHGYAADYDSNGSLDESNDNPSVDPVDPGSSVPIPFDIANIGHNADTYDITPDLPDGWTGTVYPDEDCDGDYTDDSQTPVTDTGLIDPNDTACFVLVVEVPDGEEPGDNDLTITATSHADPSVSDEIATSITVNAVAAIDFTPDRSGTVTSPGTIVYSHTVTNNGNEAASVDFGLNNSNGDWTYQIRVDRNGDGDFDDTNEGWVNLPASSALGSSEFPAGASRNVEVRVIVPDGEAVGTVDAADITANAAFDSGGTAEDTVTDTTTVVGGDLRLEKSARTCVDATCNTVTSDDGSEAKPGEYIQYTVVATNIGTADLAQVVITDPLPAYTDFVSVSGSTTSNGSNARVLYSTDGTTWQTSAPSDLNAGQSVYVGLDQDAAGDDGYGDVDEEDMLAPGETLTMVFTVKVQEAEQQTAP